MKSILFYLLAFSAWTGICFALPVPVIAQSPNVILILADDMAVGDIGVFNRGITRTPNLDSMIEGGLFFNQAYSASPVCAPARAALLTGRYPHRTGVVSLDMKTEPSLTRLHRDETTLANFFSSHGYRTGLIGKWHVGIGEGYGPIARGFHEFEGFHGSDQTEYFRYSIQEDDAMQTEPELRETYLTDELNQRAVEFVRRHASKRFFLHLAHYAPHRPIQAPPEAIEKYREAGFDEKTATIYAMIEIMDRGLGELFQELDRQHIRERTLIIFASDNGPDSLVPPRFNLNLRGTKYTIHEGGIRVPLIMNWVGTVAPGKQNELVHFVDLFPTLVELCGSNHQAKLPLDGRSFVALLRNEKASETPARFWQWNRNLPNYTHNAAIREGDWKLIKPFVTKNKISGDSDAPVELYHLGDNPQQSMDVSSQHPEKVHRMSERLEQWCREMEQDRTRN